MKRLTVLLIVGMAVTAVIALFTLFIPTVQADEVGGTIDTDTTWTLAGSPYIITGQSVVIQSGVTLTIEAGVEVQAQPNMGITVNGHLLALGTSTQLITFTSTTETGPNEWSGIDVGGFGTAVLTHSIIRHAYQSLYIYGPTDNPVQVISSTISQNGIGLRIDDRALHRLQMENVHFTDNLSNRILIRGDYTSSLVENVLLTAQPGLEGYEIFSFNPGQDFYVPTGITLTLEPGVTIMARQYDRITIDGHLDAQGTVTQPITFTSVTNSEPGQWHGIVFGGSPASGAGDLRHVVVQYSSFGIGVANHNADGVVVIADSLIKNNLYQPMGVDIDVLSKLFMTNTNFINNGNNRIMVYTDYPWYSLVADTRLRSHNGIEGYEIYGDTIVEVPEGITLTLEAGTTLMLPEETVVHIGGHLEAAGTASQPVTFTSAINTGMGQWNGMVVDETGTANLNHAVVQYSDWGVGAVDASNNIVQITNSLFRQNLSPMWASDEALHRLQMSNVTFNGNGRNRVDIFTTTPPSAGGLTADTTLTSQPGLEGYELIGTPFTVPAGLTLTMEAGTSLFFPEFSWMQVLGHLHTAGTPTMPVTLTAVNPNEPWYSLSIGDSPHMPTGSGSAQIENTIISNSEAAFYIQKLGEDDEVVFQDVTIRNNTIGGGLEIQSLHKVTLSNTYFVSNTFNLLNIEVYANNTMEGNTTLTAQPGLEGYTTYDFRIPTGITLTLEPGVTLINSSYHPADALIVEGRLQANGTAVAPVTFTSSEENSSGQWAGIVVDGGEVSLAHAEVRYATTNLTVNSPTSTVAITSSRLISASVNSIAVNDGTLHAACSVIAGNGQNGVSVAASGSPSVTITNSEIWGNGVGITNSHSLPVDARHNFWGDPSGPGGIGPGSGDAVYGNVLYEPWLTEPTCTPPPPPILPTITISGSTAVESALSLPFTVTLNITSEQDVSVNFATVDGTAVAGVDYQPISGTLTIPAGQLTAVLTVTLLNNNLNDGDRNFTLVLSNPVNGELGNGTAVGLILDDDSPVEPLHTVFLPVVIKP